MGNKMLYSIFTRIVWSLAGTGLSKVPLVMRLYGLLYRILLPKEHIMRIQVQGHQMYIDLRDQGDVRRYLVSKGVYHPQMTKVFRDTITEGMTIVDIGANIGYFTLIAAELVGKKGKVFAFEPEPHNFDLLVRNIALSGYDNIIPIQKAISDRNGKAKLFVDRISFGSHSLMGAGKGFAQGVIEVETQTLDDYFKDYADGIGLIKIDVEGAEAVALRGMHNTICNSDGLVIITEFLPDILAECGSSPKQFLRDIIQYGFKLYSIDEAKQSLYPVDATFSPNGTSPNLLAVK